MVTSVASYARTASAIALRRLQQTWLPGYRRDLGRPVNVLGIIVPTIEAATGLPWTHEAQRFPINDGEKAEQVEVLGIFSTSATSGSVRSSGACNSTTVKKRGLPAFAQHFATPRWICRTGW